MRLCPLQRGASAPRTSFAVFRLAQHGAAQLPPGHGRPRPRRPPHPGWAPLAPRAAFCTAGCSPRAGCVQVLQGAFVHSLQLCALCGGRLSRNLLMSRTLFCRASTACTLCPKARCPARCCAPPGARAFGPRPAFWAQLSRRRRRFLCGLPARGRCGLRLQRVSCGLPLEPCGGQRRGSTVRQCHFSWRSPLLRPNGRGRCAGRCAVWAGLPARGRKAVPGILAQSAALWLLYHTVKTCAPPFDARFCPHRLAWRGIFQQRNQPGNPPGLPGF